MRMFLSLKLSLCPELFLRMRWDSLVYSSRDTENKGVIFIFLQANPCGGLCAASTRILFGFCVCIYNLLEM